jgi:dGTPase
LIEFSAVAHDIGHPPFGHNGEYVLDKVMIDHGGFEGNAQTLRILTCLEKKATTEFPATRAFSDKGDLRRGLNLTVRSIAAILKYDRLIPKTKAERIRAATEKEPCKGYYFTEIDTINRVKEIVRGDHKCRFKTIECAIMDVADDIAYSTYDLEDAFAAGFLNPIAILSFDDDAKKDITSRIQRKIPPSGGDI